MLQTGQMLSHYRLIEKVGEGGMGLVWKALDTKLNRNVAIKILPPELTADPDRRLRFQREAQAAAALDHPNIAVIYEVGEHEGNPYIAMQLLEGRTLHDVIGGRRLPLDEWLRLSIPIAEGLAHAHKNGIVHRDLKPGNVMLTDEGQLKLLDFGLAKLLDTGSADVASDETRTRLETISKELTREGKVLGTVAYMSPEQARGKPIDHRSDIFSFGVLLYQMATGRLPFTGDSDVESLSSTLTRHPPLPSQITGDLPAEADRVVRKALEKDPANRYQYADELATDLKNLRRDLDSGQATMPSGVTSGVATLPSGGRGRRMILAAAAVVVVLGAGGWFLLRSDRSRSTPAGAAIPAASAASAASEGKRIVVLPFQNLGSAEDEFFADGMTEEITSRLAALDGLRVISRSSAFQYDRAGKTTRQIGADFGVDYVLDGTVRWARGGVGSSRVRITPQLIRTADDTQVWADSFDQVIDDIFEVQSEIASEVAEQLGLALGGTAAAGVDAPPTADTEAYQMYLRGLHHSAWGLDPSQENFELSIRLFQRAVDLDPEFLLAYCWLARQHSAMHHWGYDRTAQRQELARLAVDRALALDPDAPEAHLARGYVHYWAHKDYEPALREFDIALEGLPNSSELHEAIAYVLRRQGRMEEAIGSLERAAELDPLNSTIPGSIGETLSMLRRFPEAIEAYERAIGLAPDAWQNYWGVADLHWRWKGTPGPEADAALASMPTAVGSWKARFDQAVYEGNYSEALGLVAGRQDEFSEDVGTAHPLSMYEADVFRLLGREDEALRAYGVAHELLQREIRERPDDFRLYAALGRSLAGLGRKAEALRAADRAVDLYPISKDAMAGPMPLTDRLLTYVALGELDAALDQIEELLSIPSDLSAGMLRINPFFAPLRDHPRYREIVDRAGS